MLQAPLSLGGKVLGSRHSAPDTPQKDAVLINKTGRRLKPLGHVFSSRHGSPRAVLLTGSVFTSVSALSFLGMHPAQRLAEARQIWKWLRPATVSDKSSSWDKSRGLASDYVEVKPTRFQPDLTDSQKRS